MLRVASLTSGNRGRPRKINSEVRDCATGLSMKPCQELLVQSELARDSQNRFHVKISQQPYFRSIVASQTATPPPCVVRSQYLKANSRGQSCDVLPHVMSLEFNSIARGFGDMLLRPREPPLP